jgi:hypothetical protein
MSSQENNPEKIHFQVTRPREKPVDDGQGNFTISPVGFPNVNVSGKTGSNPTRLNPSFAITFEDQESNYISYAENYINVEPLFGLKIFEVDIESMSWAGSVVTVTTTNSHGFADGITVSVALVTPTGYNASDVVLTKTGEFTFEYPLLSDPGAYTSGGKVEYQSKQNDVVNLASQDNITENESYFIRNNFWHLVANPLKANTSEDMDLYGLDYITHDIESIQGNGYIVTVNTTNPHGFNDNNYIEISGATPYDGTHYIFTRDNAGGNTSLIKDGSEFLFEDTNTMLINGGYATYYINSGDLINVVEQTDETQEGLYIASEGQWSYYGHCYEYDGTENDNVEGVYEQQYVSTDIQYIHHYRKGYSHKEIADYLREKLDTSIEFARFRGSLREDHGAMIKWLQGGRRVNIGGDGASKEVFVDPWGFGRPAEQLIRNEGVIDSYDRVEVKAAREKIAQDQKYSKWGLSNLRRKIEIGVFDAGDIVDRYIEFDLYDIMEGDVVDDDRGNYDDVHDGGDVIARDFDIGKSATVKDWPFIYNTESENIITDGGTPLDLGINNWRLTTTGTSVDYIRPIAFNVDYYMRDNSYHNNITLDVVNPLIAGRQHVAVNHNLDEADDSSYNTEVSYALEDLLGATFSTGIHILKKVIVDNITTYYFKQRKKKTITDIIPMGTGWTETTLTYDASGPNEINIYLESTETDFITFSNPSKTTVQLLADLIDNNDLIPETFDPSTVNILTLDQLFVSNSFIDYSDPIHQREKIRSKKTFIHLPAPMELPDGQTFELDVSLPVEAYSDVFPFNTIGSLSGYKNFITQPRVYVLGGYQKCSAADLVFSSLTRVGDTATFVATTDHGIYAQTFETTDVSILDDFITVPDIFQYDPDSKVRFTTTGTLPGGLTTGVDFTISEIDEDKIKLDGVDILDAGSGTHTITILNKVRILIRGADQEGYNGEFDATVSDSNQFTFNVSTELPATATGEVEIDKLEYVTGREGTKGLTERSNDQIFGAMPEMEFAEDGSIYHQPPIKTDDIIGNGITDKRVLLANVYPTSTNTFPWRLDNDPQLRMLQWSLLSLSGSTGSASHVAYNRNKAIRDEYTPTYTSTVLEIELNKSLIIKTLAETELRAGDKIILTGLEIDGVEYPDGLGIYTIGLVFPIIKTASRTIFEVQKETLDTLELGGIVFRFKQLLFDFNIEESPLTYNSTTFHSESEETTKVSHLLNSYIRVLLPSDLIPANDENYRVLDETLALAQGEITGVGAYGFQGNKAYTSLISDFHKGRILYHGEIKYEAIGDALDVETRPPILIEDAEDVETRSFDGDDIDSAGFVVDRTFSRLEESFQDDAIEFRMGYNGNNASTLKPATFYDQTAGQTFIEYNTYSLPDQDSRNGYRWITKAIYTPDYVVNTQERSHRIIDDSYVDVPGALKTYLSKYFITDKERETNAGDLLIQGDLNPSVDPSFEFAVGTESLFIDYLIEHGEDSTTIDDVRRSFWDSHFAIPQVIDRKQSNRFSIKRDNISHQFNITGFTSFYGFYGIPFAKIFSGDRFTPSENVITEIQDYSAIRTMPSYDTIENTLENALESNPISQRFFKTEDYLDTFASITTTDSTNSDVTEYLRNYIMGYSNKMPLRFYDSFRVAVYGKLTSTTHYDFDTSIERIYKYAVDYYLDEYGDVPGDFVGEYIDDNFIFKNEELETPSAVAVEDYNDTWLFFDDATEDDTVLKDLISVSGMPYMVDRDFYKSTMKRNYIRVKMKFIFSRKAGRWLVTDYRQFPTSYLTPTFGNVALNYKEKSTVYAGRKGDNLDDYIPITQPKLEFIEFIVEVSNDRKTITVELDSDDELTFFEYDDAVTNGNDFIVFSPIEEKFKESSQLLTRYLLSKGTNMSSTPNLPSGFYDIELEEPVPLEFGNVLRMSTTLNSLETGTYPHNTAYQRTEKDFLWKNKDFIDRNEVYTKLWKNPYYTLPTMKMNRFAYPFLSQDDSFEILDMTTEDFTIYTYEGVLDHNYAVNDVVVINTETTRIDDGTVHSTYTDQVTILSVPTSNTFTFRESEENQSSDPWISNSSLTTSGTAFRPNFPYDNEGNRLELMNPDRDVEGAENYRLNKLLDPVEKINFVVPNNVHGGSINPNKENLKIFNPHLWKVYWHIRPAVCAMFNTDVPSKDFRRHGNMSDPVLNSMFEYPNVDNPAYHIPWHLDMQMDWLSNEWFVFSLLDAEILDINADIDREEYTLYNAAIDDAIRDIDRECYLLLDAKRTGL